jgi:PiT family inorganic phosphate transporter
VLSPLFGVCAAFVVKTSIMWIFRKGNPHKINRGFRGMQTVSAAALALGHGLQDAQKTMGVILLTLVIAYPASYNIETLPIWVVLLAAGAISAGTYAGGWRIMRTLGRKIIDLDPPRGFAAESVGATVLYSTAFIFHAPISTTHTITSAVMGAGATKRFNAVKWGMARTILTAWVSTFPAAALAAWGCYEILSLLLL